MTLREFRNKWSGRFADWDGFYGAQCVDLANFYGREVIGMPQAIPFPGEGAIDIFTSFDRTHLSSYFYKLGFNLANPPQPGDIIIWDGRVGISFGHVAIVLEWRGDSFVSFDQNFPVGSSPHEQWHNLGGVVGWLRPKNAVQLEPKPSEPQNMPTLASIGDVSKVYDLALGRQPYDYGANKWIDPGAASWVNLPLNTVMYGVADSAEGQARARLLREREKLFSELQEADKLSKAQIAELNTKIADLDKKLAEAQDKYNSNPDTKLLNEAAEALKPTGIFGKLLARLTGKSS